ncbi:hypothetical protein [Prochlorococcus marinus]|uniref:Uncharacterized protein n=1 Tax=Prochlorococcus marinus (strain MIT 9211) TaxID=93059 RepID=A9BBY4_PROM4|nr:hypothetical protein [Prochlorococcus marinus]ABX09346.1 Hypothetical protein P9211_14151 [Prochlorococcus marinus str. MIT 9211]
MDNPKKKFSQTLSDEVNFEEMDHRLACGWYVEVEGSGQRKRYLRQRKKIVQQNQQVSAI